jgi:uncharacterized membrane protein
LNTYYALAFAIGVIAGLRAMTAPAAVSWAAHLGWLKLSGTWLAFLGHWITPWIFTALALGELVTDQLPKTPSRKVPVQFGTRILMGAMAGAAIVLGTNPAGGTTSAAIGIVAGIAGAIVGTLGGAEGRRRLAQAFKRDLPAALIEDAIAVVGAYFIVRACAG